MLVITRKAWTYTWKSPSPCTHWPISRQVRTYPSVLIKKVRQPWSCQFARRQAAKQSASCNRAANLWTFESRSVKREVGSGRICNRIGKILGEGDISQQCHPVVFGYLGRLLTAGESWCGWLDQGMRIRSFHVERYTCLRVG